MGFCTLGSVHCPVYSVLLCVQCTLHTTKGELPHFADLNSLFETEIHSTTKGASLKAKI